MRSRSPRSRGFGMIEVMLVIVLMFTAGFAGLYLFKRAHDEQQVREASGDLHLIHRHMAHRARLGPIPAGDYTGDIALAIQFSTGELNDSSTVVSVYGHPISVSALGDGTWELVLNDLPLTGCRRLLTVNARGESPFGDGVVTIVSSAGSSPHDVATEGDVAGSSLVDLCPTESQTITFTIRP